MKKQLIAVTASSLVILTGCILTSVHPFYTSNDVVFEPSLVGNWTNAQSTEHWAFERKTADSYLLTYVEDSVTNIVPTHLFRLDGQLFMDIAGQEQDWKALPPPTPSHLLLKVTQLSPTLQMAPLNHDWVKGVLEKEPGALQHVLIKEPDTQNCRIVLTAATAELQAFLKKNLNNEEVWNDGFELRRDAPPAGK